MWITPAYAQDAGAAGAVMQIAPLLLIFVVFYFLLIRPQQKKMKERTAMLGSLKRGDEVITGGGVLGVVRKATDGDDKIVSATIGAYGLGRVRAVRPTWA